MLTPKNSFKACGGPKTFTSTTIFNTCGGKTSEGGRAGTLYHENPLRAPLSKKFQVT